MLIPSLNIEIYLIAYYNTDKELLRFVSLPVDSLNFFIKFVLQNELVPAKIDQLKEPSFSIILFDENQEDFLEEEPTLPADLVFIGLDGGNYIRPEKFKKTIKPLPNSNLKKVKFQLYELNTLIFEKVYPIETVFISMVDFAFDKLIEKPNGDEFYYEIWLEKDLNTLNLNLEVLIDELTNVQFEYQRDDDSNIFFLPKLQPDRRKIKFNKIKESPIELLPSNLAIKNNSIKGRGQEGIGRIIINDSEYEKLVYNIKLSHTEENGGYILGKVYRGKDIGSVENNFNWVLEITDIIPAEKTVGNSLLLLFTNETWSRLKNTIDKNYPDKKLLGWYHTHLFSATDEFGLSQVDQVLHKRFFTKPWQIALLINITLTSGERELRAFQRKQGGIELEECNFEIMKTK